VKKTFYTVATFLALKGIAQATFDSMEAEKRAELLTEQAKANEEYFKELESSIESKVSAEELATLKEANSNIIKEIERLGLEVKASKENKSNDNEPEIIKSLKENKEALKGLAKGTASKEVVLKSGEVYRANIANNGFADDLQGVGQLASRKLSMYDLFPKIPMTSSNDNGIVRYMDWDQDTTVRAAARIAEGGTFPRSEAKFAMYTLPLQKIGDTLVVSEEFFEDDAMAAGELDLFLRTNVDLVVDNKIANGSGTNDIKGIFASVPAFSATGITKVEDATIYDLLAVATEQITITGAGKYTPDFVAMRKSTINKMRLTKDANENYVIPPFVTRDGREVDGMLVVESNVVAANQLVLGDSRFARIYEKGGLVVSKTDSNDTTFVEDMMTLKVRKRLLFLIRTVDQTGFLKITDVDAAVTAITAS
jgi:hypothetical protein